MSVADRTEPEERSSVLACLNDTASLTHSLTHLLHTHTHTSHYSPPRSLTLFIRIVDLESNCCVVPESCPPHSPTLPLPHSLTPPTPSLTHSFPPVPCDAAVHLRVGRALALPLPGAAAGVPGGVWRRAHRAAHTGLVAADDAHGLQLPR